jgi:RHS repeat-associated protein
VATSSAKPEGMASFLQRVSGDAAELGTTVKAAVTATNEFEALPCDPQFRVGGLGDGVAGAAQWTNEIVADDNFVTTVRNAFVQADSSTLPDGVIDAALASAGISQTSRPPVTVDDPVYNGAVMLSGWSDDPVCTATGHFLEVEEDLVMPDPLRVLRWARSYSSRHVVDGPHGPGWASWATTRIDAAGSGVWRFVGPDGRRADLVALEGDGELRIPGVEGTFRPPPPGGGWELRWRWTSPWPGMTWRFGPDGGLASVHDPFGGTTTCGRGDDGRLLTMTHEGGRALRLAWEGDRIAALEVSDGRQVRYRYGPGGHLESVERAAGDRRYGTDELGHITEVWDGDGARLIANTYDDAGRVTSQVAPAGRRSAYTYLAPHTVTVIDEAGGPATVFRHDGIGRLVELRIGDGRRATRAFDDDGFPVHVVDLDGGETRRRFDVAGNLVWQQSPGGGVEEWAHDAAGRVVRHVGPGGAVTEIAYDGDEAWPAVVRGVGGDERRFTSRHGLPLSAVDADGVSYRAERDADGSIVAVTDGEGGRSAFGVHRTGATAWVVTPTGERTSYEVDDAGRCTAVTGPGNARGAASWSAAGRLLQRQAAGRGADRFGWDPAGLLTSVTDPAGATATLERDLLGDVTDVTLANGARWQLAHDQAGRLDALTDPTGATWRFAGERMTDPLGNVTAVTTEPGRIDVRAPTGGRGTRRGSADERREVTRWASGAERVVERDEAGRVVRSTTGPSTTTWVYTPAGRVAAVGEERGRRWSLSYDRAGRTVALHGPDGVTEIRRDAAGRPVEVTTPEGVRRRVVHGPDGRPAELVESADGGPEVVTRLEWDSAGQLRRLVQPDGAVEAGEWDAAGRLMATTDSLGATTRLERDPAGQLAAVADPAGARWSFERDLLGRPTTVTDPIGRMTTMAWSALGQIRRVEAGPLQREFAFDPDGRLVGITDGGGAGLLTIAHDGDGRGLTARDPATAASLRWDALGRVTRHGPDHRPMELAWDDDEPAVTITTAAGASTRYRCADDGRVMAIEHPTAGVVTVERDPAGRIVALDGPGVARRWRRDGRGRPVRYEETRDGTTGVTELSWDARSRLVSTSTEGRITRYTYDLAGQLVGMSSPDGDHRWAYDACGRLVTDAGPQGVTEHRYDAAGQLLRTLRADGVEVRYGYDSLGRRTDEVASDGSSTRYEWSAPGHLVAVHRTAADGTVTATELTVGPLGDLTGVDDRPLEWWPAGVMGRGPAAIGGRELLSVDGHPVAFVGPSGDVDSLSADWSGAVGSPSDPWGPVSRPGVWLWRTEVVADGLVWLHNRVYDPATRQWLSRDDRAGGLAHPGALANPYQYAANDPVNHRDPDGRRPVTAAEANQQIRSWTTPQWGKIATAAEVVGGVALCFTPLAAVGAGMLIGVGSSAGSQYLTTGRVDWSSVAISGAAGGVAGGVGSAVGGSELVANLAGNAGRFAPLVPSIANGAAGGASGGLTQSLLSGQPPTIEGLATDMVIGGATGGLLHGASSPAGLEHLTVDTPYGPATQEMTPAALAARSQVEQGAPVYRLGTLGKSETPDGQFWALEHPATPGYAGRYGIPPENVTNADFLQSGRVPPGGAFITRSAPGVGSNPGGGIEVVTPRGGVDTTAFSYLGPKGLTP